MDVAAHLDWSLIGFSWGYSIVSFIAAWIIISKLKASNADKGVFVQGAFRSNLGIIGIALCINSYGEQGVGQAALLLAMVTPLFNVLSVIVLSFYSQQTNTPMPADIADQSHSDRFGGISVGGLVKSIALNPLIISIAVALPLSFLGVKLPGLLAATVDSISQMTLPLALLCIGGALDLKALKAASGLSLGSSLLKLFIFPFGAAASAYFMGFEAMTVGIVFLMFASPTAAASFVMAKAMKGNAAMAANIIAITTVMAAISVSLGLFLLKSIGWAL